MSEKSIINYGILPHETYISLCHIAVDRCENASSSFYDNIRHFHNFYELIFVDCGDISFEINDLLVRHKRGSIHIITPSDSHCQLSEENANYSFYTFKFDEGVIDEPLSSIIQNTPHPIYAYLSEDETSFVELCASKAYTDFHQVIANGGDKLDSCMLKNLLELILVKLLKYSQSKLTPADYSNEIIYRTLEYIRLNYQHQISLGKAAEYSGLSRSYFSTYFKNYMKINFVDYLNNYRMNIAVSLLRSTDEPVSAIALNTGFGSYTHFFARFKEIFGISPSEYRKIYRRGLL